MKHHFARHGIPDTVISDNGPQYSSMTFQRFSHDWGFVHEPICPGNSKANGAAEATVKVAKNLLRKCVRAGEDPYLGLLNLRNTPTEGLHVSPSQMLFGRRTKTIIPTNVDRLRPSAPPDQEVRHRRENLCAKRIEKANSRTKELPPLNVGDTVRMQPIQHGQNEWQQATVTSRHRNRGYGVQSDTGQTYKRNRQFLRRTVRSRTEQSDNPTIQDVSPPPQDRRPTPVPTVEPMVDAASSPSPAMPDTSPKSWLSPMKTRSGRLSKPPVKLDL